MLSHGNQTNRKKNETNKMWESDACVSLSLALSFTLTLTFVHKMVLNVGQNENMLNCKVNKLA